MHDTAFHIGSLAMNIYADLQTDSILEVGSQAVNGSLRSNAFPTSRYLGLDIEEGEGVDQVIEQGKPFPIEQGTFDLVMASSVFEHDPFFWVTFLEMCKATKHGGYIYINVPSNGVVHRYPQDNWRFYPDSGRALAKWAVSQGQPVTLVESFIAGREKDIWNDFVAVFRKGRITKTLPDVFIHEHVRCTDVITWKSDEISNPSERTEDAILLDQAKERAEAAEKQLLHVSSERDSFQTEADTLKSLFSEAEHQRQLQLDQADRLRADLGQRASELKQRQEEIHQTRSELSAIRAELSLNRESLEAEIRSRQDSELALAACENLYKQERAQNAELIAAERNLTRRVEDLASEIKSIRLELDATRKDLVAAEADLQRSRADLDKMRSERAIVEARLNERFREIATISELLGQAEANERRSREQLEWLCEASSVLVNGSTSLKGRLFRILPAMFESKRQRKLLKRRGLFDGEAYLAANPDVAADHVDPLRHYLKHGIGESRRRD